MNWDDLKHVLAVHRGGTLAAAAHRLGVDQTTVSRRLLALEKSLDARLFMRPQGRLVATELGERVAARAERVEAEVIGLASELGEAEAAGSVRVTAVPIVANRLLVPAVPGLLSRHPGLTLEISADARNFNLGKRDADIALRLARPQKGVMLCRRVGELTFSVYRPAGGGAAQRWLDYEESFAHLPQARWLRRQGVDATGLRVGDAETLLAGVRAGLGQAVLPDFAARRESGLEAAGGEPVLSREVWLLVHPDLRHLPRVAAVHAWLLELFAGLPSIVPDARKAGNEGGP